MDKNGSANRNSSRALRNSNEGWTRLFRRQEVQQGDRRAVIAAIVKDGDGVTLMIGEGDSKCERWVLSDSLLKKIALESLNIVLGS